MGSCWKCLLAWCFCIELRYIWECRPIEKVQMRAVRIFIAVGRLHPLASLQFEMNMLPVK